jgi:hypothetical protein
LNPGLPAEHVLRQPDIRAALPRVVLGQRPIKRSSSGSRRGQ